MAVTITVENSAPVAAPVGTSVNLTTAFQDIAEPDNYLIPVAGVSLGGTTEIAPGVIEFTSVLFLANKVSTARSATVRILRADGTISVLANAVTVQPNDTVQIPINGQVLLNNSGTTNGDGDKLQALAEANDAIDLSIAYVTGQAEETTGA